MAMSPWLDGLLVGSVICGALTFLVLRRLRRTEHGCGTGGCGTESPTKLSTDARKRDKRWSLAQKFFPKR
jgi:hypothetical protein